MLKKIDPVTVLIYVLMVVCLGGPYIFQAYSCQSQAKLMGFRHDWGPLQGCMIEPTPGQWVPLKNYRVL